MADVERKAFQITGSARKKALADFNACMKKWGISMPKVKLHLKLGEKMNLISADMGTGPKKKGTLPPPMAIPSSVLPWVMSYPMS